MDQKKSLKMQSMWRHSTSNVASFVEHSNDKVCSIVANLPSSCFHGGCGPLLEGRDRSTLYKDAGLSIVTS